MATTGCRGPVLVNHDHFCALLGRRKCGNDPGQAGADHQNVGIDGLFDFSGRDNHRLFPTPVAAFDRGIRR